MTFLVLIFWLLVIIVFYTYIGYGIFLWLWLKVQKISGKNKIKIHSSSPGLTVAMIIPAYNEVEVIEQKLNNSRALQYPSDLLKIVVVTDGSNDGTADLVKKFPDVLLLHDDVRRGKAAAMNRAAVYCRDSDILVFTDANTIINTEGLLRMMEHYDNKDVGGVAGEKKVLASGSEGDGESLYWKYESFLKKLDSEFYSVVGAAGELFSVRSKLYRELPPDTLLDDFILSLEVCKQGYVVKYEPGAVASEMSSANIEEEEKRKKRIGAGAFQGMQRMTSLLNIFSWGRLSFQYISRRFFRWAICPPALPLIFFLNILIVSKTDTTSAVYLFMLWCQVTFYVFALLDRIMHHFKMRKFNLFFVPYYFVFMNWTIWAGLYRYLRGRQSVLWEKSERGNREFTTFDRKST